MTNLKIKSSVILFRCSRNNSTRSAGFAILRHQTLIKKIELKEKFSVRKRKKSFNYAFEGIKSLLADEHNSRIHLVAAIIVIALGLFFELNRNEWFMIILSIGFVFASELFNSSIENISDLVSPEKNQYIKKAKDQGAAAVLIAAICSAIIGLWIFVPKILALFN